MDTPLGEFGGYAVTAVELGDFFLDGGAMCGPIPRPLWERHHPPDERNRIRLASRALYLRSATLGVLIDAGMGDSWNEREQTIFSPSPRPVSDWPAPLDALLLTHCHFDHAGGLVRTDPNGACRPTLATLPVLISATNWDAAWQPTPKERQSYRRSHLEAIRSGNVRTINSANPPFVNVICTESAGHTAGMLVISICEGHEIKLIYPSDIIPTAYHLHPVCHTAYDMAAGIGVGEKRNLLDAASRNNALIVFCHDPQIVAARVESDGRGWFKIIDDSVIYRKAAQ